MRARDINRVLFESNLEREALLVSLSLWCWCHISRCWGDDDGFWQNTRMSAWPPILTPIIQISPVLSTLSSIPTRLNVMPHSSFSIAWFSKPTLFLFKCNTILNRNPTQHRCNTQIPYYVGWGCSVVRGGERIMKVVMKWPLSLDPENTAEENPTQWKKGDK